MQREFNFFCEQANWLDHCEAILPPPLFLSPKNFFGASSFIAARRTVWSRCGTRYPISLFLIITNSNCFKKVSDPWSLALSRFELEKMGHFHKPSECPSKKVTETLNKKLKWGKTHTCYCCILSKQSADDKNKKSGFACLYYCNYACCIKIQTHNKKISALTLVMRHEWLKKEKCALNELNRQMAAA